jgi:hypothetical protein
VFINVYLVISSPFHYNYSSVIYLIGSLLSTYYPFFSVVPMLSAFSGNSKYSMLSAFSGNSKFYF